MAVIYQLNELEGKTIDRVDHTTYAEHGTIRIRIVCTDGTVLSINADCRNGGGLLLIDKE